VSNYPEWQKQMREDQAAALERRKADQEAFEESEEKKLSMQSEKIADLLEVFGLPVGLRHHAGRQLDSFYFGYNAGSGHIYIHRIPNVEDADKFDEMDDLLHKSRFLQKEPDSEEYKSSIRAWIADALDEVEADYQKELVRYDKRQEALAKAQANSLVMQTDAEQIYELMYKMFEIMQRGVNQDVF